LCHPGASRGPRSARGEAPMDSGFRRNDGVEYIKPK
jgi:hypothetical protein